MYYYKKVSRDLKKKLREMAGKEGVLDSMQTPSIQSEVASEVEPRGAVEVTSQDKKLQDGNIKVCWFVLRQEIMSF